MLSTIIASSIVLAVLYFIVTDRADKVIVVISGAILMVIAGHLLGFYTQKDAFKTIDFNTLGLLLGMMVIASILKRTGFFTYIAINIAKLSKGKPWMLMALMGISTAFFSMLVDNVTTVVIMMPISILVCDILGISPLPVLMAEILLSLIGGVATLVGDPPNIFIGSAAGLSFDDFLVHLFPVTLAVIFIALFMLRFIHRNELSDKPRNFQAVLKIDARKAIKDRLGMTKSLIALGVTFLLFILHDRLGLCPSFIALFGAGLAFFLLKPKPEEIFHDVEWPVLAFFACFFVIVGGLQGTGVLDQLAKKSAALAYKDLKLYKVMLLWVTGLFSSIIGAVPFTMVMLPVVKALSVLGIDDNSFWWILALGVGFGANGLPLGHAASILGMSISKKSRSPITMKTWFFSGTIVAITSLIFVTILILMGVF